MLLLSLHYDDSLERFLNMAVSAGSSSDQCWRGTDKELKAKAMRARFLSLLLFLLLASSGAQDSPLFSGSKRIALTVQPVAVEGIPHARLFRPLGGWILSSDDPDFGGLSALSIGKRGLTAVADTGVMVDFAPDWRAARIASLPRACVPHQLKRERDSESLARDPSTNQVWIGFEYRNLLCRIDPGGSAKAYAPPSMKDWPKLGGPEAMVRRADGRFLVFAEKAVGGGATTPLLLFDRDPVLPEARVIAMRYRTFPGYQPSDAAMLPDGRMLVLNRRYVFPLSFSAIVTLVEPFTAKPGTLVEGRPVIVLAPPHIADNFEGLDVETKGSRTFIWLVSDDNFLPQQHTYLLKFELVVPRSGSDGH